LIVGVLGLHLRASAEACRPLRFYREHMPRARIATFVVCGITTLAALPGVVGLAIHPDGVEEPYGGGIAVLVGAVALRLGALVAALAKRY
jgi:hypothetical protein